ncbi:MAG: adenosylcobinamide-GDP ribazoletransferase [Eubacteriales bacterium]
MRLFNSFIIAFATYSRIPMPRAEWNDENMKYSICFFPLVGAAAGILLLGLYYLAGMLLFNIIIFAAAAACLPVFITGGIHMDGFCDTIDALSSYQPIERKLEILKDSNSGAFAVIKCAMWFLLYFAAFTQISATGIYIVSVGYVLSRALSGLAIVHFKTARGSGLAAAFKGAAHKRNVTVILIILIVFCVSVMICISPFTGGAAVISAGLMFIYCRVMSYGQFGGITGDIAGYFLVMCEFAMVWGVVITEGVLRLWN